MTQSYNVDEFERDCILNKSFLQTTSNPSTTNSGYDVDEFEKDCIFLKPSTSQQTPQPIQPVRTKQQSEDYLKKTIPLYNQGIKDLEKSNQNEAEFVKGFPQFTDNYGQNVNNNLRAFDDKYSGFREEYSKYNPKNKIPRLANYNDGVVKTDNVLEGVAVKNAHPIKSFLNNIFNNTKNKFKRVGKHISNIANHPIITGRNLVGGALNGLGIGEQAIAKLTTNIPKYTTTEGFHPVQFAFDLTNKDISSARKSIQYDKGFKDFEMNYFKNHPNVSMNNEIKRNLEIAYIKELKAKNLSSLDKPTREMYSKYGMNDYNSLVSNSEKSYKIRNAIAKNEAANELAEYKLGVIKGMPGLKNFNENSKTAQAGEILGSLFAFGKGAEALKILSKTSPATRLLSTAIPNNVEYGLQGLDKVANAYNKSTEVIKNLPVVKPIVNTAEKIGAKKILPEKIVNAKIMTDLFPNATVGGAVKSLHNAGNVGGLFSAGEAAFNDVVGANPDVDHNILQDAASAYGHAYLPSTIFSPVGKFAQILGRIGGTGMDAMAKATGRETQHARTLNNLGLKSYDSEIAKYQKLQDFILEAERNYDNLSAQEIDVIKRTKDLAESNPQEAIKLLETIENGIQYVKEKYNPATTPTTEMQQPVEPVDLATKHQETVKQYENLKELGTPDKIFEFLKNFSESDTTGFYEATGIKPDAFAENVYNTMQGMKGGTDTATQPLTKKEVITPEVNKTSEIKAEGLKQVSLGSLSKMLKIDNNVLAEQGYTKQDVANAIKFKQKQQTERMSNAEPQPKQEFIPDESSTLQTPVDKKAVGAKAQKQEVTQKDNTTINPEISEQKQAIQTEEKQIVKAEEKQVPENKYKDTYFYNKIKDTTLKGLYNKHQKFVEDYNSKSDNAFRIKYDVTKQEVAEMFNYEFKNRNVDYKTDITKNGTLTTNNTPDKRFVTPENKTETNIEYNNDFLFEKSKGLKIKADKIRKSKAITKALFEFVTGKRNHLSDVFLNHLGINKLETRVKMAKQMSEQEFFETFGYTKEEVLNSKGKNLIGKDIAEIRDLYDNILNENAEKVNAKGSDTPISNLSSKKKQNSGNIAFGHNDYDYVHIEDLNYERYDEKRMFEGNDVSNSDKKLYGKFIRVYNKLERLPKNEQVKLIHNLYSNLKRSDRIKMNKFFSKQLESDFTYNDYVTDRNNKILGTKQKKELGKTVDIDKFQEGIFEALREQEKHSYINGKEKTNKVIQKEHKEAIEKYNERTSEEKTKVALDELGSKGKTSLEAFTNYLKNQTHKEGANKKNEAHKMFIGKGKDRRLGIDSKVKLSRQIMYNNAYETILNSEMTVKQKRIALASLNKAVDNFVIEAKSYAKTMLNKKQFGMTDKKTYDNYCKQVDNLFEKQNIDSILTKNQAFDKLNMLEEELRTKIRNGLSSEELLPYAKELNKFMNSPANSKFFKKGNQDKLFYNKLTNQQKNILDNAYETRYNMHKKELEYLNDEDWVNSNGYEMTHYSLVRNDGSDNLSGEGKPEYKKYSKEEWNSLSKDEKSRIAYETAMFKSKTRENIIFKNNHEYINEQSELKRVDNNNKEGTKYSYKKVGKGTTWNSDEHVNLGDTHIYNEKTGKTHNYKSQKDTELDELNSFLDEHNGKKVYDEFVNKRKSLELANIDIKEYADGVGTKVVDDEVIITDIHKAVDKAYDNYKAECEYKDSFRLNDSSSNKNKKIELTTKDGSDLDNARKVILGTHSCKSLNGKLFTVKDLTGDVNHPNGDILVKFTTEISNASVVLDRDGLVKRIEVNPNGINAKSFRHELEGHAGFDKLVKSGNPIFKAVREKCIKANSAFDKVKDEFFTLCNKFKNDDLTPTENVRYDGLLEYFQDYTTNAEEIIAELASKGEINLNNADEVLDVINKVNNNEVKSKVLKNVLDKSDKEEIVNEFRKELGISTKSKKTQYDRGRVQSTDGISGRLRLQKQTISQVSGRGDGRRQSSESVAVKPKKLDDITKDNVNLLSDKGLKRAISILDSKIKSAITSGNNSLKQSLYKTRNIVKKELENRNNGTKLNDFDDVNHSEIKKNEEKLEKLQRKILKAPNKIKRDENVKNYNKAVLDVKKQKAEYNAEYNTPKIIDVKNKSSFKEVIKAYEKQKDPEQDKRIYKTLKGKTLSREEAYKKLINGEYDDVVTNETKEIITNFKQLSDSVENVFIKRKTFDEQQLKNRLYQQSKTGQGIYFKKGNLNRDKSVLTESNSVGVLGNTKAKEGVRFTESSIKETLERNHKIKAIDNLLTEIESEFAYTKNKFSSLGHPKNDYQEVNFDTWFATLVNGEDSYFYNRLNEHGAEGLFDKSNDVNKQKIGYWNNILNNTESSKTYYVPKQLFNKVNDYLVNYGIEKYKEVRRLDSSFKPLADKRLIGKYVMYPLDVLTNAFKRAVLPSTSYIVNNVISNEAQILSTSGLVDTIKGSLIAMNIKAEDLPVKLKYNLMKDIVNTGENNTIANGGIRKADAIINLLSGKEILNEGNSHKDSNFAGLLNFIAEGSKAIYKVPKLIMEINSAVENLCRKQAYGVQLSKARRKVLEETGREFIATPELIKYCKDNPELEALLVKNVEDVLGNYQDFSKTEKRIFKRIFPFYSWIRTWTRYQIHFAKNSPSEWAIANAYWWSIKNNPDDDVKEWQNGSVDTGLTDDRRSGKKIVSSKATYIPLGELAMPDAQSSINPFIKLPIELALGKKIAKPKKDYNGNPTNTEGLNDRRYFYDTYKKKYYDTKDEKYIDKLPISARINYALMTTARNTNVLNNSFFNTEKYLTPLWERLFGKDNQKSYSELYPDKLYDTSIGGFKKGEQVKVKYKTKKGEEKTTTKKRYADDKSLQLDVLNKITGAGLQLKKVQSKEEKEETKNSRKSKIARMLNRMRNNVKND